MAVQTHGRPERNPETVNGSHFYESAVKSKIRRQSHFLHQHLFSTSVSDLQITKDGELIFNDYESITLRLPPIERTLYLLLLKHQSGLNTADFTDFKQELIQLYKIFRNQDDESVKAVISKLVNPLENSLQEKISKINKTLKTTLQHENRYKFYLITNQNGRYSIPLQRGHLHIHQSLR